MMLGMNHPEGNLISIYSLVNIENELSAFRNAMAGQVWDICFHSKKKIWEGIKGLSFPSKFDSQ